MGTTVEVTAGYAAVRRVLLATLIVIAPPRAGVSSIADLVAVSAVSVAELEYGVGAAADPVE